MKLFSFEGRSRRRDYWLTCIGVAIGVGLAEQFAESLPVLFVIICIPMLWLSFANGARRCHDLGHNGWWQLIHFYTLWLAFKDGQPDENEYGPNLKDAEIGSYAD